MLALATPCLAVAAGVAWARRPVMQGVRFVAGPAELCSAPFAVESGTRLVFSVTPDVGGTWGLWLSLPPLHASAGAPGALPPNMLTASWHVETGAEANASVVAAGESELGSAGVTAGPRKLDLGDFGADAEHSYRVVVDLHAVHPGFVGGRGRLVCVGPIK